MGSPSDDDARPVVDLFEYITSVLGAENKLSVVCATGLALAGQINMDAEQLAGAYKKLGLNPKWHATNAPVVFPTTTIFISHFPYLIHTQSHYP